MHYITIMQCLSRRSYDDKGGYSSLQLLPCNHIQAAVRCYAQAQPLHIKHEILQTLILSQEVKQVNYLRYDSLLKLMHVITQTGYLDAAVRVGEPPCSEGV
jgi:hypothetical protein